MVSRAEREGIRSRDVSDRSDNADAAGTAERRVVLHPRTAAARRLDRSRLDGGHVRGYTTDTDEVLDYMRAHRRLALRTFVPVVVALSLLLGITVFWQSLGTAKVGDIPMLWLILGPVALFSILFATVRHERHALRLEEQWMDKRR